MIYHVLADLLLVFHLLFIVFVIAGGLLLLKWPWVAFLHVPAAIWGALVEINGWLCILTPWENTLRNQAGQEGYSGGFIEHYIVPLIYPAGLDRDMQVAMGGAVIVVNLCVYSYLIYRCTGSESKQKGRER